MDEAGVGQHVQDEGQHQVVEEIFVHEGGGITWFGPPSFWMSGLLKLCGTFGPTSGQGMRSSQQTRIFTKGGDTTPRSKFGFQQRGTAAGEPNHKDRGGHARCWSVVHGDGFDGFERASCFFWIPRWLQQPVGVGPRRPRAFMITRSVEDPPDAKPQSLLHDGLGGVRQSLLKNVQGPFRLPGSIQCHRSGVRKLPVVQQIGLRFHHRDRFVESATALECGKSSELTSNAGWCALKEIQCGREITLVQTKFTQTTRGFRAIRNVLQRLLPVLFRFVVSPQPGQTVPGKSKQHGIFRSCGKQRPNQGKSPCEVAPGQGFVQGQRNSSSRSPHFWPAWLAEACMGCCTCA